MSKHKNMLTSTLHRALQSVFMRGLGDPRITGNITVTQVRISPDCRHATVLVSVYPEDAEELTMHGLQAATRHVRRRAGDLVSLSRMPELRFELDKGLKHQSSLLNAITEAALALEKTDEPKNTEEQQNPACDADSTHPEDAQ